MEKQHGFTGLQHVTQLPRAIYPMETYQYPCSDPPHNQCQVEAGRESLGSDCSVPGMVEDHGSDVSVDEDYQYHTTGTDLWDSFWQIRTQDSSSTTHRYPALIDSSSRGQHNTQDPTRPVLGREDKQASQSGTREGQLNTSSRPPNAPSPTRQRPQTPKVASYSLFPPTDPPDRQIPPIPPRKSSFARPLGATVVPFQQASKSPSLTSHDQYLGAMSNNMAKALNSMSASTTSIPSMLPPPAPAPAEFPRQSPWLKPLPEPPGRPRTAIRRPSFANLRKFSFSNLSTRSSSSLAHVARTQAHAQGRGGSQNPGAPGKPSALRSECAACQPPVARSEPPAHVSVFEVDSDDEEDSDEEIDSAVGNDERGVGLARRFMRGLMLRSGRDTARDIKGTSNPWWAAGDRWPGPGSGFDNLSPSSSTTTIRTPTAARQSPVRARTADASFMYPRPSVAAQASSEELRYTFSNTIGNSNNGASFGDAIRRGSAPDAGASARASRTNSKPWLSRHYSSDMLGRLLGRHST
ncbi:hypothetical protein B0T24DRAFT_380955 [Lasiosphaeria ovina]|uniref:Uncharacterized protein n=1 Tax=Lasiosphaeria ovina TaxID=92902 RepID=A0AAE0K0I5_9PEZI|nr:hypothetical protein B0T24DRAFT_380955 [Lasiosphaeria ovina]